MPLGAAVDGVFDVLVTAGVDILVAAGVDVRTVEMMALLVETVEIVV